MGWNDGTLVFDAVADLVLHPAFNFVDGYVIDDVRRRILFVLAAALEDRDWDTLNESKHLKHPVVQSIVNDLHPDWSEDDDNG